MSEGARRVSSTINQEVLGRATESGSVDSPSMRWPSVQGSEVFEFVTSGSRGWAQFYSITGAKFIRIGNLNHDSIALDLREVQHVNPPIGAEGARTRLRPNDLLISITAELGMVALVPNDLGDAYINQHIALARPRPGWDPRYLAWYFASEADGKGLLKNAGRGGTKVGLGLDDIREVIVPVAPIPEQKRIADKLDTVLTRVDAVNTRLARVASVLKRFRQSVLAAATSGRLTEDWRDAAGLEWMSARRTLSDLAEVVTGSTPSKKESANFGGAVPFFKPSDLDQGYSVAEAREYLSVAGAQLARTLPAETVLVTCIGATIGKTGLARVGCTTNQQINALVPRSALVLPAWLYFWCCSPTGQQAIVKNSSATTLPILNKSRFSALEADVPPLVEQAEVVRRVETLFAFADRLEARLQSARTAAERLTPALLAKAFRGELVPQDPNDDPASELLRRLQASPQPPHRAAARAALRR